MRRPTGAAQAETCRRIVTQEIPAVASGSRNAVGALPTGGGEAVEHGSLGVFGIGKGEDAFWATSFGLLWIEPSAMASFSRRSIAFLNLHPCGIIGALACDWD